MADESEKSEKAEKAEKPSKLMPSTIRRCENEHLEVPPDFLLIDSKKNWRRSRRIHHLVVLQLLSEIKLMIGLQLWQALQTRRTVVEYSI